MPFRHPQQIAADDLITIGALAKAAGVTVRTLRYYEELGLIAPACRTNSQYRLYAVGMLRRIKAILALQDMGYTLEAVLVVLGTYTPADNIPRQHRVDSTEVTLKRVIACIDDRMTLLHQMKVDVQQRLHTIQTVCHPCTHHQPNTPCETTCNHRDAHMD
jgi:DNA-binding transcriptional MerR regulator